MNFPLVDRVSTPIRAIIGLASTKPDVLVGTPRQWKRCSQSNTAEDSRKSIDVEFN